MRDLLIITAFVFIMAYLQAKSSKRILSYNANLTTTQVPKKDYGIFMIIAMIIMMALAMLRGESVGSDTNEYYKIFINVITNPDYANISRYELGFIFLNKFVGKFTSNPQGIIICAALIYYPIYIWFMRKHSRNYALSLILFYLLCFGSTLNIIRQEIAMALLLVAYDRVINKKTISAYFWIIIAFLFHSSAILFVIMPILPHIKFNRILAIVIVLVVLALTASNGLYKIVNIFAPQYAGYFNSQKYSGAGSISVTYELFRNTIFFVIIYLVVYKIKDNNVCGKSRLNQGLKNNIVLWLVFICSAVAIFGYRISLIDRIVTYFGVFYIILVPNALKKYDKRTSRIFTLLIVGIMTVYMILGQIYRPEWNIIYPYQFFWQ